ncbi:hypothetical protein EVAR_33629_1 [Eumeta japonica]|uniref:Uncharacterized protein n=1 Tax=Eumeta variegata TaxID=151549 RepID=A0A4C1WBP9_EUMVA|nr:hypothetical protein EVAR_33629_1 [Eumeta japonica]
MEMKKPRMNYTNSQKRTPKALHRVKKMKNRRLTGKTNLLQISYTYKRYYNGNQEEQSKLKIRKFLAKGCTNTGWLYKLPSLLIQNRIYTPPDIYAPFGVSGLVPFSHCDWLKVER